MTPRVKGNASGNLPRELDRMDRRCRAAADEFILRDAGNLALYAGMSAHTISRQREYDSEVVPALAKVGRLVLAGIAVGRGFEEIAAFLSPVLDAAGADLVPRATASAGDLIRMLGTATREAAESEAATLLLLDGADADELAEAERQTAEAITSRQRLLAEIRHRREHMESTKVRAIRPT